MNSVYAVIAVWLLGALTAAYVADRRGNSSGAVFVLSLLIGPAGIIFAFAMMPNRDVLEERQIDTGQYRRCPYCAEVIHIEARVCPYCRIKVEQNK